MVGKTATQEKRHSRYLFEPFSASAIFFSTNLIDFFVLLFYTIDRQIRSSSPLRGLFFRFETEGPFLFDIAFFIYNMIHYFRTIEESIHQNLQPEIGEKGNLGSHF